jgi:hypothetical protein
MRKEWANGKWTAICIKYPKHYEMCHFPYYIDPCIKFKNHDSLHLSSRGLKFSTDYLTVEYYRPISSSQENK